MKFIIFFWTCVPGCKTLKWYPELWLVRVLEWVCYWNFTRPFYVALVVRVVLHKRRLVQNADGRLGMVHHEHIHMFLIATRNFRFSSLNRISLSLKRYTNSWNIYNCKSYVRDKDLSDQTNGQQTTTQCYQFKLRPHLVVGRSYLYYQDTCVWRTYGRIVKLGGA